ncbi:MAG TPA: TetR/AcrR family transcriptional regulator [Solirubrobacterales bacterium]|nr:TetR/AcrR family transcriptional regulator [Solirubrobacterales bacterium]
MAGLPQHLARGPIGQEAIPREVVEEHQRRRIALAACPVFAERGYRAATIDDIVAAARISVGSFYGLFDGKEGCFLVVYDMVVGEARERLAKAVPGDAPWPEAAGNALRELLRIVTEEPLRARIVLVEAPTAGAAAEQRYAETMAELAGALRGGRDLRAQGADLPVGLESATVAGIAWLLHQRLVAGQLEEIPALLAEVAELVFEPYLGPRETEVSIEQLLSAATP